MNHILNAISHWAKLQPQAPAISGIDVAFNYQQLHEAVASWQAYLEQQRPQVIGILMDNSPAWVIFDLAAQAAGIPVLPIPAFFSAQQIQHAINETACDYIITDQVERFRSIDDSTRHSNEKLASLADDKQTIWEIRIKQTIVRKLEPGIAKITYTSGTTGTPKGVCLSQDAINTVAQSLCSTVDMQQTDRHLSGLPLATLLENIAGVYVPLLAGAQSFIYPLAKTGLRGATEFDVNLFHQCVDTTRATTTVLVPLLLQQLVEYYECTALTNNTLRFIAVGGAPVSSELLQRAAKCQLPVYEGYGLSECASVVAVNDPQHHRPGSVGKLLPHVNIKFAHDNEILVKGACFAGYLGQDNTTEDFYATGDTGYLDDDGYLYITGRKKNMFITAFGRNVSPDWIESELIVEPAIKQVAVFGEGRAWNVALVVAGNNTTKKQINTAIEKVNENLPDYARIKTWLAATEDFSLENMQLTATGRLRRNQIWQTYADRINDLYSPKHNSSRKTA